MNINKITNGTANLDDYKVSGIYYFSSGVDLHMAPGVSGWLMVFGSDDKSTTAPTKQVWFRHGTVQENDYQTFVRTYSNYSKVWSEWAQLVMVTNNQQSGKETVFIKGGSVKTVNVAFDTPFQVTPDVVITPRTSVPHKRFVSISLPTKTGFALNAYSESDAELVVGWIATAQQ